MAEELESVPLEQLIEEQIAILQSENTTREQVRIAFFRMRQYKPLRDLLDTQKDEIAAKLANPDEIKKLFLELLSNEQRRIKEGTKHPVELDEARPPAEIAEMAASLREAERRTNEAIKNKLPNLEPERKTYASRVANAWVAELRNRRLYDVAPESIEEKVLAATETLPAATTAEDTKAVLASTFLAAIEADTNLSPHAEVLRAVTQTIEPPEVFMEAAAIREQTNRIILETPDITRPDLLVTFVAQGVDTAKAQSLTRVAEGLSLDINPAIDPTRPSVFFQAVATTGLQKLAAPAVDAIMTVLPQETREQIIESVLERSWNHVVSPEGLRKLEERFGTGIVQSVEFRNLIKEGNNAFAAKPKGFGGVFGALTDVAVAVSGTGLEPDIVDQLEARYRTGVPLGHTALPSGATDQLTFYQMYVAMMLGRGNLPEQSQPSFVNGRWVLGLAGQKAVGVAAKAAATRLGGTAIGATLGSVVPGAGTLIGAATGFIGGKVLGGIKSLVGGLLGLRGGEEEPWWQNILIMGPLLVIGTIVLLFMQNILPVNAQQIGNTSQSSALADIGGGVQGGGLPRCDPKTDPACALKFCDSAKQDCRWPTASGCVTQGPDNGTGTHARLNAVDISGSSRQAVFATHNGSVVVAQTGFGLNQFQSASYGNYVEIAGTDATGKRFWTLYAHLAQVLVTRGQAVTIGQQIGTTDNNGNSFGEHLHYEYGGGGDISTILPIPVPHCTYGACPRICW